MAGIELLSTRIERGESMHRLVGAIQLPDGGRREIHYAVAAEHGGLLHDSADPFLPALLVPAMVQGVDLRLRPAVSEQLLEHVEAAQDVIVGFHGFRRATVSARPRPGGQRPPATAAHFSGGVDSCFTLLRSLQGRVRGTEPARYLLFFKGLEQPLSMLREVDRSIAAVEAVAAATGTRLLVVETNLRDVFDPNYELYTCGAALASASLALACGIGTVLVPSGMDYRSLVPLGSHPLLDPLFSSERQRQVFSGCESTRAAKIEALVREWPESLAFLRVCLKNDGGGSNCGRCRKCARTMVVLEALGALDRAPLFPRSVSKEALRALSHDHEPFLREISEFAHRVAPGRPITATADAVLRRARRRAGLWMLLENTPGVSSVFGRARSARRFTRSLLYGNPGGEEPRLRRRLLRLREQSRRHGLMGAARWAWNSRHADRSRLVFFALRQAQASTGEKNATAELRWAAAADVERLTSAGKIDPESPQRLAAGDACLLQLVSGRLAGWGWLSTRPEVDLVPGVRLCLPQDAGYAYGSWTAPEFRGRGLQPQRALALLAECQRRGRARLLCFVDATNLASQKGVAKAGYRPVAELQLRRMGAALQPSLTIGSQDGRGLGVRLGGPTVG